MGREEQIEEREVLESIFPDEITDIDETSYKVSIALDVLPSHEDGEELPSILLTVTYPPDYPSIPPTLSLSHSPTSPKPPHLTLPSDSPHLLSLLAPTISENLGQAMIFTLISTLKDSTEALIQSRQDDAAAEADKERAKAEEAENAKFVGEQVTRESFLKWREGFRAEMEREGEERRRVEEERKSRRERVREEEGGKMSGRELWERGLVGRVEEDGGDEEKDALGGLQGLKVGD